MTPALNTESKKKPNPKLSQNSLKTLSKISQIHQMDSKISQVVAKQPFCKFCFDSGKPDEVVHSHWIKDSKDGKPCCPTLAATKCGYCKGSGHTPKFCPRLKSRDQRRKIHEARMSKRNHQHCGGACVGDHMDGVQNQMKQLQLDEQKRKRVSLGDNAYAALVGCRDAKRSKDRKTKSAPVWNGPKASAPRVPQGAWGKAAKAAAVVKNMTSDEVSQLKVLLSQMGIMDAPTVATEEQVWLEAQMAKTAQTLEETAAGEAFFDNDADTAEAVVALAAIDQPALRRQGAFGIMNRAKTAPLPAPMTPKAPKKRPKSAKPFKFVSIPLSGDCDMDRDLEGGDGCDGWGSDDDDLTNMGAYQ
jgi:hypothetical protein